MQEVEEGVGQLPSETPPELQPQDQAQPEVESEPKLDDSGPTEEPQEPQEPQLADSGAPSESQPGPADWIEIQTLRVRRGQLDKLIENDLRKLQKDKLALERDRIEFDKLRKTIAEVHLEDPIILDVGGQRFKTSLATLRKVNGSLLAEMFSGTGFKLQPAEDGSFFIDRDGTHFRHILNFLRDCFKIEGLSPAAKIELAIEADFYQIPEMYTLLRPGRPRGGRPPYGGHEEGEGEGGSWEKTGGAKEEGEDGGVRAPPRTPRYQEGRGRGKILRRMAPRQGR